MNRGADLCSEIFTRGESVITDDVDQAYLWSVRQLTAQLLKERDILMADRAPRGEVSYDTPLLSGATIPDFLLGIVQRSQIKSWQNTLRA